MLTLNFLIIPDYSGFTDSLLLPLLLFLIEFDFELCLLFRFEKIGNLVVKLMTALLMNAIILFLYTDGQCAMQFIAILLQFMSD